MQLSTTLPFEKTCSSPKMATWPGSLIFKRLMSKTKSSVGITNHTNVWENSQGLIGDYANKPINMVTLDYLLTLQKGGSIFQFTD